jgi:hypothetical protein
LTRLNSTERSTDSAARRRHLERHVLIVALCHSEETASQMSLFSCAEPNAPTVLVYVTFNKYKTFSVLIYSYINTSGNWENECFHTISHNITQCQNGNVAKCLSLYFFVLYYKTNIKHFFRIDIKLYQHGKCFIFVK